MVPVDIAAVMTSEVPVTDASNSDAIQSAVYWFIRLLMKLEREKNGLSRWNASTAAGWSGPVWGDMELDARTIHPDQWRTICGVLQIDDARLARRLNTFIEKFPALWLRRHPDGRLEVFDRDITTPQLLKDGDVHSLDLNENRPVLFATLSNWAADRRSFLEVATNGGFTESRPGVAPNPIMPGLRGEEKVQHQRARLCHMMAERISDDKLDLLERVLDKFATHSGTRLKQAYRHFSLSLRQE